MPSSGRGSVNLDRGQVEGATGATRDDAQLVSEFSKELRSRTEVPKRSRDGDARAGQAGDSSHCAPGLDILVVEDHPDTRRYLILFLRQLGHAVREAGTVGEALRSLDASGCDVLISDVGLPDGCGLDLLGECRSERVGYAIAMSGFGTMSDRSRSREAGYCEHLLKPFDVATLAGMLDTAVATLGRAQSGLRGA